RLDVSGCEYDVNPAGPWGRALVAPGSSTCTVVAKVDARGLAFPVLLDPAWVATFNTVTTHAFHHLFVLPTGVTDAGKVLLLAGTGGGPLTSELFDPATNSWAASSTITIDSSGFGQGNRAVMLTSGNVLIAGGLNAAG